MSDPATTEDDLSGVRERLRSFFLASRITRRSLLPILLVLAHVAAWLAFHAAAPLDAAGRLHPAALVLAGAKVNALVTERGELWRLVASLLLHADGVHLAVNCAGALLLAQLADNVFGWARTVVVYVGGGVAGGVASTFLADDASVGASGAVYALLGALLAFAVTRRRRVPRTLRLLVAGVAGLWLVASLLSGWHRAGIDSVAHAGGLAGGVLLSLALGGDLPVFHAGPWRTPIALRIAALACVGAVAASLVPAARGLRVDFDLPPSPLDRLSFGGLSVPVPADWTPGAAEVSGRTLACRPGPDLRDAALAARAPTCLQDPYGTALFVGRGGDLLAGLTLDPSLTLEGGQREPSRRRSGDVAIRWLMLNREIGLVLAGWDLLAPKYDGLLRSIVDGVRLP